MGELPLTFYDTIDELDIVIKLPKEQWTLQKESYREERYDSTVLVKRLFGFVLEISYTAVGQQI